MDIDAKRAAQGIPDRTRSVGKAHREMDNSEGTHHEKMKSRSEHGSKN